MRHLVFKWTLQSTTATFNVWIRRLLVCILQHLISFLWRITKIWARHIRSRHMCCSLSMAVMSVELQKEKLQLYRDISTLQWIFLAGGVELCQPWVLHCWILWHQNRFLHKVKKPNGFRLLFKYDNSKHVHCQHKTATKTCRTNPHPVTENYVQLEIFSNFEPTKLM